MIFSCTMVPCKHTLTLLVLSSASLCPSILPGEGSQAAVLQGTPFGIKVRVSLGHMSSSRIAGSNVHVLNLTGWYQMLPGWLLQSTLPPAVMRAPYACQHVALSSCLFCHSKRCEVLSCFNGMFLITNKCEYLFMCLLISSLNLFCKLTIYSFCTFFFSSLGWLSSC